MYNIYGLFIYFGVLIYLLLIYFLTFLWPSSFAGSPFSLEQTLRIW
jgi:hypothetical protein